MAKIKQWWKTFTMTPVEKYLSEAQDAYELERMIKQVSYQKNVKAWML